MELKTPPKQSVFILNDLIVRGYELLEDFQENFSKEHEKGEKKHEEEWENEKYNTLNLSNLSFAPPRYVADIFFNNYWNKLNLWVSEVKDRLKEIFIEECYAYEFKHVSYDETQIYKTKDGYMTDSSYEDSFRLQLTAHIGLLNKWHTSLSASFINPFFFDPKTCTIWFQNLACPLKAETNMSELSRLMFQKTIGEKVEYEEIYKFVFGEDGKGSDWPKNWKGKVDTTYREVNKKTTENFGFNIFSKEGVTLSISLPPHFLKLLLK